MNTIALSPEFAARLERAFVRYAARIGDASADSRRILEVVVIQRGLLSVEKELDEAVPLLEAKAAE